MVSQYNSRNLRKIKTARTVEEINEGANNGQFPLIKKVTASNKIKSTYAIFQHEVSGHIYVTGYERPDITPEGYEMRVSYTEYYPYNFPEPYAAYLIPPDLELNELVYIEDLIEDVVGSMPTLGHTYRLESGVARWNGEDFVVIHDEPDGPEYLG